MYKCMKSGETDVFSCFPYLRRMYRSFEKSQCFSLSTSTLPQGYDLHRIDLPERELVVGFCAETLIKYLQL